MRVRLSTIAVALWSFVLNLLLQKGWLDWVPDGVVVAALLVPLIIWGWLGLTHHRFRNFVRKTKPIVALIIFVVVGAIIGGASGGVLYQIFSRPGDKSDATRSDEEKKPAFVIDYLAGNCVFFTASSPSSARLDGRKGLAVYDIKIVNNTGGVTTLKEVLIGYEDRGENVKREASGIVFPMGKLKNGQSAWLMFSPKAKLFVTAAPDIRIVIGENKEKVSGAIWRGSAFFIFGEDVKSFDDVMNPRLIARDYLNHESEHPLSPISNTDLKIRDEPFVQENDDTVRWTKQE